MPPKKAKPDPALKQPQLSQAWAQQIEDRQPNKDGLQASFDSLHLQDRVAEVEALLEGQPLSQGLTSLIPDILSIGQKTAENHMRWSLGVRPSYASEGLRRGEDYFRQDQWDVWRRCQELQPIRDNVHASRPAIGKTDEIKELRTSIASTGPEGLTDSPAGPVTLNTADVQLNNKNESAMEALVQLFARADNLRSNALLQRNFTMLMMVLQVMMTAGVDMLQV